MTRDQETEAAARLIHLHFLESIDRIDRVMRAAHDLETLMSSVLDEVLDVLNCDRAALVYPCDPESATWTGLMERTRPEYPGILAMGLEIPTAGEAKAVFQALLEADGVVRFGPGASYPLPARVAELFGIQSQIAMAVYPKGDKPWMFVLHQCSYPRIWTDDDAAIFLEIGRRLADSLTSLLITRDLRKSEERLRSIFDALDEGVVFQEKSGKIIAANPSAERILGVTREALIGQTSDDQTERARIIHEDGSHFPGATHPSMQTLGTGRPQSNVVMGLHHPDGTLVWISANSQPLIAKGEREPYAVVTSFHDITHRKRTDEALQRLNRELRAISDCNQALLRAVDEQALLNDICRIICDKAGYRMAWVGLAEHDEAKTVRPVAWAGSEDGYLAKANITWADVEGGRGPTGTAIRSGQSVFFQDFAANHLAAPWREAALQRGYRSSIALPLKDETGKTFGALNIYSAEPNTFTPGETKLLEELAGDLAYGIVSLRARRASKQAEQEREDHTNFLASMDKINLAIQGSHDLDSMMIAVLDEMLAIFECNRAFLLNPCDPRAESWTVPMERTTLPHSSVHAPLTDIPMDPPVAEMLRALLDSEGSLTFGPSAAPLPANIAKRFELESLIATALHPKRGTPWGLGIHQCATDRVWGIKEERLLRSISGRLADALTTMLILRDLQESEGRLYTLVQTIPDLVWLKDTDGVYLRCNARFERLYGAKEAAIIGKTDYDFVPSNLADYFRENDRAALASGKPSVSEEWLTFADDGYRGLFETIKMPLRNPKGEIVGVLGIGRDITDRFKANEQLRVAATAFESQEGMIVTDAAQAILRVNRAFTRITGYSSEEVVGKTPRLLRSDRHDSGFYRAMWEQISAEGAWQGEIWNRRKNGEIYPEWLSISAVRDQQGAITHYVGTMLDITAHKEAERQIEYLAFFDPLTQLPNRRLLLDRLQQALASGARDGLTRALLFIDLDNFKFLNDSFGHNVGDRLLEEVAQRLSGCVRKEDTVARLGGDEFVALLEDLSEAPQAAAAQAKNVGEKILAQLRNPYLIAGHDYRTTASLGITLFSDSAQSVDELLMQADIAMYQAKSAGGNIVSFFDPATQAALASRAQLEAMLRVAIRDRQFELYYQPQVDFVHGIVGAEALARWQHPKRGLVWPDQFISIAEENGLILDIGRSLLENACTVLSAWAGEPATRNLHLSINVSARQFRQDDFVEQVRVSLHQAGAPASRLKIELTESAVLNDVEGTIAKMQALKSLGVGFSIDDFGVGYSSLSYLTQLPLDELKIDQSFVRNLPDNANDAAVVQTIIALAKALNLNVIAEGVESEAQRQFLRAHHCPIYQGYLFSEPVTLARFEQLLGQM